MNSILLSQLKAEQVQIKESSIRAYQIDKGITKLIQRIFDKTFEWYAKRPNKIKPVPIWLLKLYDDFSRWKEEKPSKQNKTKSFIKDLVEKLYKGMVENLGESNVKRIFSGLEKENL
ncbi:MAG: hypothetical protein R2772_03775 [Chitinophagales bacterium]|nr:hypothetical protein [Erysipelotrichaceae bacterium]